jgi:hypothetical protein
MTRKDFLTDDDELPYRCFLLWNDCLDLLSIGIQLYERAIGRLVIVDCKDPATP